jgi:hypothetical protein
MYNLELEHYPIITETKKLPKSKKVMKRNVRQLAVVDPFLDT